jgi:hypothetical protein
MCPGIVFVMGTIALPSGHYVHEKRCEVDERPNTTDYAADDDTDSLVLSQRRLFEWLETHVDYILACVDLIHALETRFHARLKPVKPIR